MIAPFPTPDRGLGRSALPGRTLPATKEAGYYTYQGIVAGSGWWHHAIKQ
jgi:hypothetical protein